MPPVCIANRRLTRGKVGRYTLPEGGGSAFSASQASSACVDMCGAGETLPVVPPWPLRSTLPIHKFAVAVAEFRRVSLVRPDVSPRPDQHAGPRHSLGA